MKIFRPDIAERDEYKLLEEIHYSDLSEQSNSQPSP